MIFSQIKKVSLMLCVAGIVVGGFSQSSVTFNVNGAADTVQKEMFGVLMERLGRQWGNGTNGGIYVGTASAIPNTNGMRNDVMAGFTECGVGSIQWPGGCAATSYTWSPPNPANDVGTDRFIQFCSITGATPVICGPRDAAASNLAWVKHIDSQMTSRGMGLLKWFKDGNEVWGGCGSGINVATYMPMFTRCYNAMNPYRADLNLEACNDMEGNWAWITTMVNSIGSQIDGVEYHDYIYYPDAYSGSSPTTAQYWQIMYDVVSRDFGGHIRNNIIPALAAADPSARIKLVVDEWGDWLIDDGDGWMQRNPLFDGISAGMHLHVMMPYAKRITVACLAQGVSCIHSLMNINTSNVMVKTPAFYVFKMLKPHQNAKWCPISTSSIENTTQTIYNNNNPISATMPVLTVGATVDNANYVNVSFTNIDLSATRQVTVTLTSSQTSYTVASAQVVTGAAYTTYNAFGSAESVNMQTLAAGNYTMSTKTLTVTLPARSVVMIRLQPPSAVQPSTFAMKPEAAFSITSSVSWKTPVTISLYGVDGRTLIDRVSRTFEAENSTCVLGNNYRGRGVYIVKITGADINLSKKVVVAR
jgi:alpha-N-arabinofuranosidase